MTEAFSNLYLQIENDVSTENCENFVNPWSVVTLKNLLLKMNNQVAQYGVRHLVLV